MQDVFDFNEYLKDIEKDFKNQLNNIPDDVLTAIMERSLKDAKQLLNTYQQDDFKSVVYILYRSYILGMLLEKQLSNQNKQKQNNIIKLVR